MLTVAHFFTHFRSLGGVETMLQQHYAQDQQWGLDSAFVILDEQRSTELARVHFLELTARSTIREVRDKMKFLGSVSQPLLALYHSAPVMRSYVCAQDRAARRVVMLHGKGNDLAATLRGRRTWLDGVVSVSDEARSIAQGCLPELAAERFRVVPVPVTSCAGLYEHPPLRNRKVVVGFCGRLLREHKRVDRLPELCSQLDRLSAPYRLEILGDGPEQPWLEQRLGGNPRVKFLGRRGGEEYRRTLSRWDVIVFVSDTEGQPVSLIESLSGGVVPVFPAINSAGDSYVKRVDARLLYPVGAMGEAAQIIHELSRAESQETGRLRSRCREAVTANLDGSYFRQLADFGQFLMESKRVSTDQFPRYPAWLEGMPLGWVTKAALLRRRLVEMRHC